jgi:hypothetical protein
MSVVAPPPEATAHDLGGVPPRPITVEEYHEMIDRGVFAEDERFELLEGWVVRKMSRGPRHDTALLLLVRLLTHIVPSAWHVRGQTALTTSTSEPEPDIGVARGDIRDYAGRHPGPQDMDLIVEVADSSIYRDRGWKKRIYARARTPVYWILNLADDRLEVYTDPIDGPDGKPTYRTRKDFARGDSVAVVLGGKEIGRVAVDHVLP